MFVSEVRFYREIAPHVGVRVPRCIEAGATPSGTVLRLEDLSAWQHGGDPVDVAAELRHLHDRWTNEASRRWPWLRRAGAAAGLIAQLFDRTWSRLVERRDLADALLALGGRLVGRAEEAIRAAAMAGPPTLCHGDASLRNVFTSRSGEIAFVDSEDVSCMAGVGDLAWLLVSSVPADRWDEVIDGYGAGSRLTDALPAAAVQGLLSLADEAVGSAAAFAWNERLSAASRRLRE